MFKKHNFPNNIEGLFIDSTSEKGKRLLGGMYNPPQYDKYFFNTSDQALKNVLLIGDFNVQVGKTHLDTFLDQHELANINKEPTCYKSSGNRSCIDFICLLDHSHKK